MDFSHLAPLFVLGFGVALVGWAMVHISAQIERRQAEHLVSKYAPPSLPRSAPDARLLRARYTARERDLPLT
jgi:hypothetical protein